MIMTFSKLSSRLITSSHSCCITEEEIPEGKLYILHYSGDFT